MKETARKSQPQQIVIFSRTPGPLIFEILRGKILPWDGGESAMDQRVYIAQLNIEHYRRKLLTERDEAQRQTINRLLAAEEAKLAELTDPPGKP